MVNTSLLEKIMGYRIREYKVFEKVDVNSPHGIYIYDKNENKWIYVSCQQDIFIPKHDGIYVVYFDNTKCPACRIYDIYWFPYVSLLGSSLENTYFTIVLCEWFAKNCKSRIASNTFKYFDIHASPTTLLLCIQNGEIRDKEKVEGVKTMDKLADIVESFARRNNYL